jgi:hypothetical protein
MANLSKTQLIERAKALGLKVGDDWTRRNLVDAIEIAEADAEVMQDDSDEALGEIGIPNEPVVAPTIPEPPEAPTVTSSLATPEPTPTTVSAPPSIPLDAVAPKVFHDASSYDPSHPRIGAGRYHVLWTVTLSGKAVDKGIIDLNDAQARSLVAQGAVVHVDNYDAYLAHNASTKAVAKPQTHPTRIPSGAGRYRTIGGVMKNGREIPHGTVAEFTATEVANLTKPGMIAIEFAD